MFKKCIDLVWFCMKHWVACKLLDLNKTNKFIKIIYNWITVFILLYFYYLSVKISTIKVLYILLKPVLFILFVRSGPERHKFPQLHSSYWPYSWSGNRASDWSEQNHRSSLSQAFSWHEWRASISKNMATEVTISFSSWKSGYCTWQQVSFSSWKSGYYTWQVSFSSWKSGYYTWQQVSFSSWKSGYYSWQQVSFSRLVFK